MDNLSHMVTFAHVVRAGSFAGAAQRLGLAASVVSKHVSKLERSVGAHLLARSTRKLSLTEAGSAYYAHCARILEEIEQSQQAIAELQAEPRGRLRVSAMPSFANCVLAPLLPEFHRRYPKIELEILCNERMVDLAEEGFDLALRITGQPAAHLVARRLAPIRFGACASPEYLRTHGTPEHPAELAQHECLGYSLRLTPQQWRFRRGEETAEVATHCPVMINSIEAVRRLALAGMGIALLPTYAINRDMRSGRLVPVLPGWYAFDDSSLYAVYMPNRFGSPKLRAFLDFVTEHFTPPTVWERDVEIMAPPPRSEAKPAQERVIVKRRRKKVAQG